MTYMASDNSIQLVFGGVKTVIVLPHSYKHLRGLSILLVFSHACNLLYTEHLYVASPIFSGKYSFEGKIPPKDVWNKRLMMTMKTTTITITTTTINTSTTMTRN